MHNFSKLKSQELHLESFVPRKYDPVDNSSNNNSPLINFLKPLAINYVPPIHEYYRVMCPV